ncbi:MAG: MBL fold metallo-hydrolase [Pyrinomonadaceae bacterium]|nr:MBL fold metallo-hydrolase [Pyrinomonadaceae bacterium]
MYFKQIYLGCLAHASYIIGSEGEAAIVDPQRDVEQYLDECQAQNLKIKYIIETHLHRDFVSGHCELARRTGAKIVYSHKANAEFPHRKVTEGDEIAIGSVTVRVIETPGHTPESVSLLVFDREAPADPPKVLTGDTLFVGDVGRPDLAGAQGYTAAEAALSLYDSLHKKLLTLDDHTEVYPAHGAGSACGRNISKETSSTIGEQRRTNYALRPMSKEEFVRLTTTDLPEIPAYFPFSAEANRTGASALDELPRPARVSPAEVARFQREGVVVLDVRTAADFGAGHVPGSINVGLGGQFATWAGSLIATDAPVVLVADDEREVDEAVMRLARVGLENARGFLGGGIEAWKDAGFTVTVLPQISVDELHERIESEDVDWQIVDVRRPGEYAGGHVPGGRSFPLSNIKGAFLDGLDPERPVAVVCAGGYRSSAAASILEARGFRKLLNVTGGTTAYVNAGYKVE